MFVPLPLLVCFGVLLVIFLAIAFSGGMSRDPLMGNPHRPDPRRQADSGLNGLSPDQLVKLRALIDRGNKIEAIKLVRDWTRLGLKEAKDLVEGL